MEMRYGIEAQNVIFFSKYTIASKYQACPYPKADRIFNLGYIRGDR